MFIHSFSKCSRSFSNIMFWHLEQVIKYITFEISHVICLGKSIVLCDFFVKLHETRSLFLIKGQYVHLPNLLQMLGFNMGLSSLMGG